MSEEIIEIHYSREDIKRALQALEDRFEDVEDFNEFRIYDLAQILRTTVNIIEILVDETMGEEHE